jgi:hypothetical protein
MGSARPPAHFPVAAPSAHRAHPNQLHHVLAPVFCICRQLHQRRVRILRLLLMWRHHLLPRCTVLRQCVLCWRPNLWPQQPVL